MNGMRFVPHSMKAAAPSNVHSKSRLSKARFHSGRGVAAVRLLIGTDEVFG